MHQYSDYMFHLKNLLPVCKNEFDLYTCICHALLQY